MTRSASPIVCVDHFFWRYNPARCKRCKEWFPFTCGWPVFPADWTWFPPGSAEGQRCSSQFAAAASPDPPLQGKQAMRKAQARDSTELSCCLCLNLTQMIFFWLSELVRIEITFPSAGTCHHHILTEMSSAGLPPLPLRCCCTVISHMTHFKFWLTFNLITIYPPSIPPSPSHLSTQLTWTWHRQCLQCCVFTGSPLSYNNSFPSAKQCWLGGSSMLSDISGKIKGLACQHRKTVTVPKMCYMTPSF